MTIEEVIAREAIRDTMARYHIAGDRLRFEEFAILFTEDGLLESAAEEGVGAFRHEGRAAILGWMKTWSQPRDATGTRQASFIRHHLTTCRIDILGADEAAGRSYFTAWTDIGPDHAGVYLDRFRRVGDSWLIAHRTVRIDWRAAKGLYRTASSDRNSSTVARTRQS